MRGGGLDGTADVGVKARGKWKKARVRFRLDPDEKRETEVIFTLLDILGNVHYEESTTSDGNFEKMIDVSNCSPGFYWLRFNIDGITSHKKVVIRGN